MQLAHQSESSQADVNADRGQKLRIKKIMSPIQVAQVSALLGFKTFDQLSEEQQQRALKKEMDTILTVLCEVDPDSFYDELAVKLKAAWEEANEMRTPWFIGEYVMDTCKEEVEAMAKNTASEIIYKTEPDQEIPVFADISK